MFRLVQKLGEKILDILLLFTWSVKNDPSLSANESAQQVVYLLWALMACLPAVVCRLRGGTMAQVIGFAIFGLIFWVAAFLVSLIKNFK